jgi:hypothetical protein
MGMAGDPGTRRRIRIRIMRAFTGTTAMKAFSKHDCDCGKLAAVEDHRIRSIHWLDELWVALEPFSVCIPRRSGPAVVVASLPLSAREPQLDFGQFG